MLARNIAPVRSRLPQLALLAALLVAIRSAGGGGCDMKMRSFADDIDLAAAAVLVERVSEATSTDKTGPTTYRVLEILKDERGLGRVGDEIQIDSRTRVRPGATGLMLGRDSDARRWFSPSPLSRDGWDYVRRLPPKTLPEPERAAHFTKFLTHNDPAIAEDVLIELSKLPVPLVADTVDDTLRADLRTLVVQESIHPARRGLFAKLIGLTGNDDDRALLRDLALRPTTDLRIEAGGLMSGYLAVAGEDGLRELEQQKLLPAGQVFSERYAVMQAIKFCHENAPQRIPAERLGQTLLLVLDDPSISDLVFNDLRRMQDWSAVERAPAIYDSNELRQPAVLRAMIRYLHVAAHPELADRAQPTATQQAQAAAMLTILRDREPKRYAEAHRFWPTKTPGS